MNRFHRVAVSLVLAHAATLSSAQFSQSLPKLEGDFSVRTAQELELKIDKDRVFIRLKRLTSEFAEAKTPADQHKCRIALREYYAAQSVAEQTVLVGSDDTSAKSIKQQLEYTTKRDAKSSSWFKNMLDRAKQKNSDIPKISDTPQIELPSWLAKLSVILGYLVIAIVFSMIIFGLVKLYQTLSARKDTQARRGRQLANRGGLLAENDAVLSEDEYLRCAEDLIAAGQFREACRFLYIATLLRANALRLVRFEPAQTNWEHLQRYEASPTSPTGLWLREATVAFDWAWYGFRAKSEKDVEIFRRAYTAFRNWQPMDKS